MSAVLSQVELPRGELLKLSAVDSIFYCRQFFPKTFRLESPDYHRDFWQKLENPDYDFFAAEIFRDGAKTTLTRAAISKRIAFGVSRTILSVAISETMAVHTVRWLKTQIETNTYWTETFMLRKGNKWTDDWIEIYNVSLDLTINIMAKGMTSGLRGLNLDDYRPDFIVCDDICNEENTNTEDQRTKTNDLLFGALVPGLSPKSESPNRKLVLLQTGLHKEDSINKAHLDHTFQTVKYPKLVTKNGELVSAWPQRFSTEVCLKEREDYTKRNQYHIYLREFGVRIISRETAPLDPTWLRYWKSLPEDLAYFGGIDPATDSQSRTAHKSALGMVGLSPKTGDIFISSYYAERGKNPDELWGQFLSMQLQFRPRKFGVETVAFQKMLEWYFKQKMLASKRFFVIDKVNDKRSKANRIIQAFSGPASQGKIWVNENQTEFIQGWTDWDGWSDWDLGDALAQAITLANPWLQQSYIEGSFEDSSYLEEEKDIPDLVFEESAP